MSVPGRRSSYSTEKASVFIKTAAAQIFSHNYKNSPTCKVNNFYRFDSVLFHHEIGQKARLYDLHPSLVTHFELDFNSGVVA